MTNSLNHDQLASQPGPLDGIVIADFSRVLAGPYCTMLLADMGATVIKVEGPGGDDTRQWTPPERDGVSTYYLAINRNKHSIALDLSDPAELDIATNIIDQADVFVENFKPGSLAKFGLDPASVAKRWPRIVHASITGFGSAGGADMPGYDLLAQAMSGMMSITGSQDGPPQRAGVAMFDVMTGMHAAIGILGALREREISGLGQQLEVNLLSSALSGLVNQSAGYAAAGNVPTRLGNDHPSVYPYGPFATADRDLIIACGNDNQFAKLVHHLGLPELADDERFRTNAQRNEHREELRTLLEEALSTATADEWFAEFRAAKLASAPILTIGEGVEFADEIGLNPIVEAGKAANRVPTIKHPIDFSRTPARYDKAPPAHGADRDAILTWLENQPSQGSGAHVSHSR